MSYSNTNGVDPTAPVGSTTPLASVDTEIQDVKVAFMERLDEILGVDFENDDPILPTKLGLIITGQGSQAKATYYNAGNSGAAKTISWNDGNSQKLTLTANTTLTFTNPLAGAWYSLELIQDATGGRSITFPATVRWNGGSSAPSFTTTANRVSVVTLYYTGSVYIATLMASGVNVS